MGLSSSVKVSVITVCLNSEKYLERAISSVISQAYANIEYIIIDGGSTDKTSEILSRYRHKIDILVCERDNGIYDAQNKGIRLAGGDILCLLNSDDRFYNEYVVEKAVKFFKESNADFVYGNMLCSSIDNSEFYLKRYPDKLRKRYFLRGPLGHSATFFRKDCFDRAGYYDTRYRISADYEWYLRTLFKVKLRSSHIDETISVFQEGGESSRDTLRLAETDSVLKLYFTAPEMFLGKFINFFWYGDFLRFISLMLVGKKNYGSLRSFYRKKNNKEYLPIKGR